MPLRPGVVETLANLACDFRLAVVTGASQSHYNRVHARSGLGDFFEVTITSDEYEHAKPHPEAYLMAAQRLALEPEHCLAIEDSPRGAAAAIAAGIRCFVIPTGLTDIALCPPECTIIEGLARVVEHIENASRNPTSSFCRTIME